MSKFCNYIHVKVYYLCMCCRLGRLCLWSFALCTAFPCSLSGRYSTDYYNQSVPPIPLRPKHVSLSRARMDGSSVAVWLLEWR